MNGAEKEEILVAIAKLEEKNEHLELYIFKDLKPDIERLCKKVELCAEKTEDCYHKNLRWMIATLVAFIAAVFGWIGLLVKVML